jgi:hypothetical protein
MGGQVLLPPLEGLTIVGVSGCDVSLHPNRRRTAWWATRRAGAAVGTLVLCSLLVGASGGSVAEGSRDDRPGVRVRICLVLELPRLPGTVGVDLRDSLHLPRSGPPAHLPDCPKPTPSAPPSPSPSTPAPTFTPEPSSPMTPVPARSAARPQPGPSTTPTPPVSLSSASAKTVASTAPSAPASESAASPRPAKTYLAPSRHAFSSPDSHRSSMITTMLVITVPALLVAVALRPRSRSSRRAGRS